MHWWMVSEMSSSLGHVEGSDAQGPEEQNRSIANGKCLTWLNTPGGYS